MTSQLRASSNNPTTTRCLTSNHACQVAQKSMEVLEECFVCGVTNTQLDNTQNAALLSVLATLLGRQLGPGPLPAAVLCGRCCQLLTEAAALQQRLQQVKTAVLSIYRPVHYPAGTAGGGHYTTPPTTASCMGTPITLSTQISSAGGPTAENPSYVSATGTCPSNGTPTAGGPAAKCSSVFAVEHSAMVSGPDGGAEIPAATVVTSAGTLDHRDDLAHTALSSAASTMTGAPSSASGPRKATTARRLPCQVCGKSVTARYLRAHQRQHSGERPFSCSLCGRGFAKSSDLATHRRRHAGDRRHRCPLCPAAFFFPHELARHRLRHGETRPHLCPVCGAGFLSRAGALRHQRVDHPAQSADGAGPPPPPLECGECGKRLACERSLRRHVRAHGATRKYMCEECGVTYKTSTALRFHTKRQHSGERPFQCEVCGRQFITRSVWLRHLRVHTGEAPFRCQFCAANYKDKQKLKRHYVNKHATEVQQVGVENLRYAAAPPPVTAVAEEPPPLPPPPPAVDVCTVTDLDPDLVQSAVCSSDWSQQWKAAGEAPQTYGDASAAVAEHGTCGAMLPQEMPQVEMMQDSGVLPQGMLYEAQSTLFSYF